MMYCLLPFSTCSENHDDEGLPDIRHALSSRQPTAARNSVANLELLDHVVESLCELPWCFMVDHCCEHNGQLHLAIHAIDLARNLDVEDKINAGFLLQSSETALFDTVACARVFRVVCSNGAVLECEKGQSFSFSARDRAPADWQLNIRNVIDRSFSAPGLDLDLARFRATTTQLVVAPYELLCQLSAQELITDDEQSSIQEAFMEEADFSMYGFINAVTQVAHSLRSNDRWMRAFEIERLGGEILRGDHNLPMLTMACM